ncbi:MAG: hypothetical protein JWP89_1861 [Schlesneria sp.]|nr:hypothetical protein [Schlesneria sp.]
MNDKDGLLSSEYCSITGSMSPEDYVNAQRLHRRSTVVGCDIVSGLAALIGIALLVSGYIAAGSALLISGIGGIVTVLIFDLWLLPRRDRQRQARRGFLNAKFTYTWNSEKLAAESAIWQSERAWSDYVQFKESKAVLLLYHPDKTYEIFPKTWFEDSKQLDQFRSYALQTRR